MGEAIAGLLLDASWTFQVTVAVVPLRSMPTLQPAMGELPRFFTVTFAQYPLPQLLTCIVADKSPSSLVREDPWVTGSLPPPSPVAHAASRSSAATSGLREIAPMSFIFIS